jgi:RimJ/RimL family protein N-acetyltransferase
MSRLVVTSGVVTAPSPDRRSDAAHLRAEQHRFLAWAAARLDCDWPPESLALAVLEGDEIRAVIVFNAFYERYASMHIVTDQTARWASRAVLAKIFTYAFDVLALERVSGYTPSRRIKAITMALRLGFVVEGRQREAAGDGDDLVLTGLLRRECRWLRQRPARAVPAPLEPDSDDIPDDGGDDG